MLTKASVETSDKNIVKQSFAGFHRGSDLHWYGSKLRENAKLFADFCNLAYLDKAELNNTNYLITGWTKISSKNFNEEDNSNQFRCHVLKQKEGKENLMVFAFKGMHITNIDDILAVYAIVSGEPPLFLDKIYKFIEKTRIDHGLLKSKVYLCGHSLGGYIANMLAITHGFNTVTFDSPGINIEHVPVSSLAYNKKHFRNFCFLSHPNVINCFGEHYFDIYYIATSLEKSKEIAAKKTQAITNVFSGVATAATFFAPGLKDLLCVIHDLGIDGRLKKATDAFGFLNHIHGIGFLKSSLASEVEIIKLAGDQWFRMGSCVSQIDFEKLSQSFVFIEKAETIQNKAATLWFKMSNEMALYTDGYTGSIAFSLAMLGGIIALYCKYGAVTPLLASTNVMVYNIQSPAQR